MPDKSDENKVYSGPSWSEVDYYGVPVHDAEVFGHNIIRRPGAALIDLGLSTIDKIGGKTHIINVLRDINAHSNSLLAGVTGKLIGKIIGNPELGNTWRTAVASSPNNIYPLPVRANNYTDEQQEALRVLSDNGKHGITAGDYYKYSRDHKYGGDRNAADALSVKDPIDMIQYSIGQSSGGQNRVYDIFDFNNQTAADNKTNEYYKREAEKKKNSDGNYVDRHVNYFNFRALAPKIFSNSSIPNWTKVHTSIDFNN